MTFYFTNAFGKTKEFEPSHLSDMPGCVVGYELPENRMITLHSSRLTTVYSPEEIESFQRKQILITAPENAA